MIHRLPRPTRLFFKSVSTVGPVQTVLATVQVRGICSFIPLLFFLTKTLYLLERERRAKTEPSCLLSVVTLFVKANLRSLPPLVSTSLSTSTVTLLAFKPSTVRLVRL